MIPETKAPGQRVAYRRVSSLDQSTARQLDGMTFDREFTDKASGKDTSRPALQEALAYLREGDRLVTHSMDRLCRNLGDLRDIVKSLTSRGVAVEFVKENMVFTNDSTPMAQFMLNIMGSFAELERAMILSRQREGVAIARAKGVYKGRVPAIRSNNGKAELFERLQASGAKVTAMAKELGVSRQTIYSMLKAGKMEVAA
jgi:DNA invertase Pin-like site-specific DNA recombinase